MAEFYCDISAVGNEYQAYADTSASWAVPQDGNGKAGFGHAAACPVAEVTFAAVPTSGTISVYGVSVTLTGVLSAASTSAAATALAASINATTATTEAGVCQNLLPLNRFVFARVKPTDANTVQIMCRIAGADLNFSDNASARVTNTFNNSAMTSPVDFAGGADGPFAYLYNTTTVFGRSPNLSGSAAPAYGIFFNAAPGPTNPGMSDVVHLRTRRSGSNLAQGTWQTTGTLNAFWRQRCYLADDGTVWSGDNGQLVVSFKTSGTSGNENFAALSSQLSISARKKGGFVFEIGSIVWANVTLVPFRLSTNSILSFTNCIARESSDNVGRMVVSGIASLTSNFRADLSNSKSEFRGTGKSVFQAGVSNSTNAYCVMNGHEVSVVAATGAIGPAFSFTGSGVNGISLTWIGGSISDTNGVFKCPNPISVSTVIDGIFIVDGVSGITDASAGFVGSVTNKSRFIWNSPEGPNKAFRLETPQFLVDWKGDGTFPYAGSAADLRGVNWSHRVTWTSIPSAQHSVAPLRLSKLYRAASAVRTVAMEMYVPDATTVRLDELLMTVSYVDSSDVQRVETVGASPLMQLLGTRAAALSAGSLSWTPNGVTGYSAKRLALTTSQPVKTGTEIMATLSLFASRSPSMVFYVSPELVVT